MRFRSLVLIALGASLAAGAAAPAFADDDWRRHERHERQEWREHEWREHEWREQERRQHERGQHEWREHAWRERHSQERYDAPSPAYYGNPGYGR